MDASFVNIAIVVVYLVAMLAFGWWGKSRTKNNSDFLVAGRRLGPFLYTGTMAAVVLGGASTVGGVGLGYKFGISGMWLVVAIGAGVLLLRSAKRSNGMLMLGGEPLSCERIKLEVERVFGEHGAAGRIVGGEELGWPRDAKTVRKKGITDGPFIETK